MFYTLRKSVSIIIYIIPIVSLPPLDLKINTYRLTCTRYVDDTNEKCACACINKMRVRVQKKRKLFANIGFNRYICLKKIGQI